MASVVDWQGLLSDTGVTKLIDLALDEDLGPGGLGDGDATTRALFDAPLPAVAAVVARSATVACGLPLAAAIFRRIDPTLEVRSWVGEGEVVAAGTTLMTVQGDTRTLLTAERCALNFLMRLCGTAQAAHAAVASVPAGCRAKIFDTRKTLPGWRRLDKAAVRTGGAENHRMGLFDLILIKDNHIAAAGSVSAAVERARSTTGRGLRVQVEVDTLAQLDEAIAAGPDMILLDNFDLADMTTAVARAADSGIELETSGGVTQQAIAAIARTGVDRISMGALTHSVMPADISMDLRGATAAVIQRHGVVESTMFLAAERAEQGAPEGTVIVAEEQRAGRGRRGKRWFAPQGAGLWFTLVLRPKARELRTLGLMAAAALCESLHQLGAADVRLKWPNDLLAGGRKVAGLLLEAKASHAGGEPPVVLLGVGLNVAAAATLTLPAEIAPRYIGLGELVATPPAPEVLLSRLVGDLLAAYDLWSLSGLAPSLPAWRRWDALAGCPVRAEMGARPVEGIARGVASDGTLRIETSDGDLYVDAGEVLALSAPDALNR